MTTGGMSATSSVFFTGGVSGPAGKVKQKSEASDFAGLLMRNLGVVNTSENSGDIKTDEVGRADYKKASEKISDEDNAAYEEYNDDVQKVNSKENDVNITDAETEEKNVGTEGLEEESKVSVTDEEIIQEVTKALEVLSSIMTGAAEILGVSEGELKAMLEDMGMEVTDLLDKGSCAELLLTLNGSNDMTDFLVDGEMLNKLNELTQYISSELENAGFTAESFAEVLESEAAKTLTADGGLALYEADMQKGKTDEEISLDDAAKGKEKEGPTVEIVKAADAGDEAQTKSDMSENGKNESAKKLPGSEGEASKSGVQSNVTGTAESFINSMEKAVQAADTGMEIPAEAVSVRDIVYQLVDKIKVDISLAKTSMELQLTPENLGKVALNITSKDGVMTAQITTQNQISKEAIESQIQILKDSIENQGIKVEAIEVSVSEFAFSESRYAGGNGHGEASDAKKSRSGRRNISLTGGVLPENLTEAEELAIDIMEMNGSSVDYVA